MRRVTHLSLWLAVAVLLLAAGRANATFVFVPQGGLDGKFFNLANNLGNGTLMDVAGSGGGDETFYILAGMKGNLYLEDQFTPTTTVQGNINYHNNQPGVPADDHAGLAKGFINITAPGNYTFDTRGDDGVVTYIDGKGIMNDNALKGQRDRRSTVALTAGKHEIKTAFFERGGGSDWELRYSGPDTGFAEQVIPTGVLSDMNMNPGGLTTNFYDLVAQGAVGHKKLIEPVGPMVLEGLTPSATVQNNIDFPSNGGNPFAGVGVSVGDDHHAMLAMGKLSVGSSGNYTFKPRSDDGYTLFIDGKPVNGQNFDHGFQGLDNTIFLTAGDHDIKFAYYERGGGSGAQLTYNGPDTGFGDQIIPASALKDPNGTSGGLRLDFYDLGSPQDNVTGNYYQLVTSAPGIMLENIVADQTAIVGTVDFPLDGVANGVGGNPYPVGGIDGDNHAFVGVGALMAPETGTYSFGLQSDDGSALWIDDELVINNNEFQGVNAGQFAQVDLTAGVHKIVVGQWENGGGSGLFLTATSPSGIDLNNGQFLGGVIEVQDVIPEPATALLGLMGLAGVGLRRRKRA